MALLVGGSPRLTRSVPGIIVRCVKLADKVAIVTGTSPNIGAGIAEGLAAEGAPVVCVDVVADNARQCAEAIGRHGGQALGVTCDVTVPGGWLPRTDVTSGERPLCPAYAPSRPTRRAPSRRRESG
ncbi:MAG: hypothetical protein DMD91_31760, partial [Candidatus Rokuibacteriota bacterium]